jgi:pyruvate/2-oxoglutarate dehydrogenase complex dihydrolipoamide dehydrogenase (E3) component
MDEEFDVIVIGGGPAGENVVGRCADRGLEVGLVENELVGGECS